MRTAVRAIGFGVLLGVAACEGESPFLAPEALPVVDAGSDSMDATTDLGAPRDAATDDAATDDVATDDATMDDAGTADNDVPPDRPVVAVPDAPFSTCLAVDAGSALGPAVATGDTAHGTFEYYDGCGGELALESTVLWTAPSNGDYRFTTEGSAYDTLLYVRQGGCEGATLGCNDNTPDDSNALWSSVTLRLHEGDPVAIFIDGFGLEGGPWTLSIDGPGVAFDGGASGDPSDAR